MTLESATVSLGRMPGSPVGPLTTIARGGVATLSRELEPESALLDPVDDALIVARKLGRLGLHPSSGCTRDLWEALASLAAHDLAVARAVEPHLDALAILDQAALYDLATNDTWGVFASEGGDDPVIATETFDGWRLSGVKQWCSLAGRLDAALVSATVASGTTDSHEAEGGAERRLFVVRLSDPGVTVQPDVWHARGLVEIPSGPVLFDAVPALPVGAPRWYLERPGFSWGGIGVAACWFGGAVGLARSLFTASRRPSASPFTKMHLGAVDVLLEECRRALLEASDAIDDGSATGASGRLLAKRVRATVAKNCEEVLVRVGHALGPAPLAVDALHAKRAADLTLYLRQQHAERDDSSLGETLLQLENAPW